MELPDRYAGLAAQGQVGEDLSHHGYELEPVAREPAAHDDVLELRMPAHDEVVVGGPLVHARGCPGTRGCRECGNYSSDPFPDRGHLRVRHGPVERVRLCGGTHVLEPDLDAGAVDGRKPEAPGAAFGVLPDPDRLVRGRPPVGVTARVEP